MTAEVQANNQLTIAEARQIIDDKPKSWFGHSCTYIPSHDLKDIAQLESQQKRYKAIIILLAILAAAFFAMFVMAFPIAGLALTFAASMAMFSCGMAGYLGSAGIALYFHDFKYPQPGYKIHSAKMHIEEGERWQKTQREADKANGVDASKLEAEKESLKKRKLNEVSIDGFVRHLNHETAEKNQYSGLSYRTNCHNVAEIDTLFLADYHGNQRVKTFNTLAARYICCENDRVYAESTKASFAHRMLDTTQFPKNVQYRSWDIGVPGNWIDHGKKIGLIYEKVVKLGQQKDTENRSIGTRIRKFLKINTENSDKRFKEETLAIAKELQELNKDNAYSPYKPENFPQDVSNLTLFEVFQFAVKYFQNMRKELNKSNEAIWDKRQNHMVDVLKADEKEQQASRHRTILAAGRNHLLPNPDGKDVDPHLGEYLETSGRKYLILRASPGHESDSKEALSTFEIPEGKKVTLKAVIDLFEDLNEKAYSVRW